jgi:hypothetical protein
MLRFQIPRQFLTTGLTLSGNNPFVNAVTIGGRFNQNGQLIRFQEGVTGFLGGNAFTDSITMRIRSSGRLRSFTEYLQIGDITRTFSERFDRNGNPRSITQTFRQGDVSRSITETLDRNGRPTSLTGTFSSGGFSMTERLQFGGGLGRMILSNMVGVSNRLFGIPPVNNNIFSMQSTQRLLISAQEYGVCLLVTLEFLR